MLLLDLATMLLVIVNPSPAAAPAGPGDKGPNDEGVPGYPLHSLPPVAPPARGPGE